MGVVGIGSGLSPVDTQYNFTSMTNKQLLNATSSLLSEGKISGSEADALSQIAQGVDSVPISGPSPSVTQILSDPTQHNFIAQLQGDDNSANLPGSVGGALYDSMLATLQTYQQTPLQSPNTSANRHTETAMQITSSLSSPDLTANSSNASTKATASPTPESFLTASDVKMLEYVTNTTSLSAAEEDPHAKLLAASIGTKREHGWIPANLDVSEIYMPAQLTASDAKMVESMTGTTNIIDAQNAGNSGVDALIGEIGLDRGHNLVSGDLTPGYINEIISFDKNQLTYHNGAGIGVPLDTLNQALAYLQANQESTTSRFSTTA